MQEHFTDGLRRVLDRAAHEARALNHHYIGTEHLLLGLAEADTSPLDVIGVDGLAAIGHVHDIIGPAESPPADDSLRFTARAGKVLHLATREAADLGHDHAGPEHLLLALIREVDGVAGQVLTRMGATVESARAHF
ncbi:MAG TPA: Clp protease N-terminal domain-containing protein [Actinophytocola sp.]|jgi:ATP-dependent Clp protease ATP-binding subunit ClpC|nr:Clp protease N-terminal domain-containing protein [Actinophytocola sp.]